MGEVENYLKLNEDKQVKQQQQHSVKEKKIDTPKKSEHHHNSESSRGHQANASSSVVEPAKPH
jgi:hypothetical protein